MRRAWLAALVLTTALTLSVPAAAKAPITGTVCGKSGCKALADPGYLYDTLRWSGAFSLIDAPRAKPFYRLTFRSDDGFRWVVIWPRGAGVLRADDRAATSPVYGPAPSRPYWRTISPRVRLALADATEGVTPFRARARWRVP